MITSYWRLCGVIGLHLILLPLWRLCGVIWFINDQIAQNFHTQRKREREKQPWSFLVAEWEKTLFLSIVWSLGRVDEKWEIILIFPLHSLSPNKQTKILPASESLAVLKMVKNNHNLIRSSLLKKKEKKVQIVIQENSKSKKSYLKNFFSKN